jgi:hypothetical protein
VIDGRFRALERVDARVDSGGVTRDGRAVELFFTFRNPSATAVATAGLASFVGLLNDADGLGMYSSVIQKPEGAPDPAWGGSPVIAPKGQLAVRMAFPLVPSGAPLTTLTLREHGSPPATFDLSPITVAGQMAGPPIRAAGAAAAFKPFDEFEVRFDGLQAGRDGRSLEAFVAFRNVTTKPQQVPIGAVRLTLAGPNGAAQDAGALWAARGVRGESLRQSVYVEPGAVARLRYVFREGAGAGANQLTVTYGRATQTFPAVAP